MELVSLKDIKKLRIAHTDSVNARINALDYSKDGESIIYNESDWVYVRKIDEKLEKAFTFRMKGHGCDLIKYFDKQKSRSSQMVHSSCSDEEGTYFVRLLDIEKFNYIHYFPGHVGKIISLDISLKIFASSSEDRSVRLWSPDQRKQIRMARFPSTPIIAIHPNGDILAVAYNSDTIEMFHTGDLVSSLRKIRSEKVGNVKWTRMKFSSDGKMIMVTTDSTYILIFDAVAIADESNELFKLTGEITPIKLFCITLGIFSRLHQP